MHHLRFPTGDDDVQDAISIEVTERRGTLEGFTREHRPARPAHSLPRLEVDAAGQTALAAHARQDDLFPSIAIEVTNHR